MQLSLVKTIDYDPSEHSYTLMALPNLVEQLGRFGTSALQQR